MDEGRGRAGEASPRGEDGAGGAKAVLDALKAAWPLTVPILAGFVVTGITCGVFSVSLGLPWWCPTLMSIAVFAGSAEFVTASLIAGAASPWTAFTTIFIVNARHLFYGLSMLERFRGVGAKRAYLVYALCDETFSLEFAGEPPAGVDRGWFMFWISLLDQSYWVVGCTLGGAFGSLLPLTQVKGISFAMTALFVVIFLDQWLKDASRLPAAIGFLAAGGALALMGPAGFMLPTLAAILALTLAARGHLEPRYLQDEDAAGGARAEKEADAA